MRRAAVIIWAAELLNATFRKASNMITWIGLCAGEVWTYLEKRGGEAKLKTLLTGVKAPSETILMALGWLAREGYVVIGGELPNPVVRLSSGPEKK